MERSGEERRRIIVPAAQVIILRPGEGELEVLLGHRITRSFPRQWAFFGGGQEEGEDLVGAAQRELYEELGLHVARERLIFFRDAISIAPRLGREYSLRTYVLDGRGLEPVNNAPNEHSEIKWVSLSEALAMHERALAVHPELADRAPDTLAPRSLESIKFLMGTLEFRVLLPSW